MFVICDLLGVPRDDRGRFAHWSDTMLNMTRFSQDEIDRSGREFYQYMTELVATKRSAPGDDLLSALAADMTATELVMTGQGLLIAGHETTANMIGKMVAMLLADREHRWERLLADPSLVPPAVEEALRFDANPGFGMPRYVSEETVVGGTTLPRGTTVVCSMASGNRDTDAFDGADMDLARLPTCTWPSASARTRASASSSRASSCRPSSKCCCGACPRWNSSGTPRTCAPGRG